MKNKLIGLLFRDSEDFRFLKEFLTQKGYEVQVLRSDELKFETGKKIDLIMIEAPIACQIKFDLLTLKQKTLLQFSFLPVIIFTSESESPSSWLTAGFDDVLSTPIDKDILISRVETWLRLREETSGCFRDLVEKSSVGFYRTTPSGRILYANPAIIEMLGFSSFEELAQRNLEEEGFEPSYPRSKFKEIIEKKGEVRGLKSIWVRKDGRKIWVRESARAVRDESGQILYYEGTAEDITDLIETEEAYLKTVERALQGMVIVQRNRVVFANPAIEKIFGYSREELYALTLEQVREIIHPEDRPLVWQNFLRRLRGEEVPSTYEFRVLHKSGETRWVKISATQIDFQGQPAVLASYLDVTEEKRLSERLEAIQKLGRKLSLITSVEEIARTIIEAAKELLGLEDVGLYLIDLAQEKLRLIGHSLEVPPGPKSFSLKARKGIVPLVARKGQSLYLPDVSKEPLYVSGAKETRSEYCVPLKIEERVIGVLNVESPSLYAFGSKEQKLIETLADVASVALGRAEYFELFRQSQERFHHLAQSSPDVIYRYRLLPKHGLEYVSSAISKITGYNAEEFYSEPRHWFKIVHPEDRPLLKKILKNPKISPRPFEIRWLNRAGSVIWMEHIIVPLYDDLGNIIAVDGIARDITERKQTEAKIQNAYEILLSLLDNVEEIIYVADMNSYEILFANQFTKRLYGKELVGGLCYKELENFDSPCPFCTNDQIKALNYAPYSWEYHDPISKKDYFVVDRVIRWPDGRDVRFEIARDITELKLREKQVKQYAEKIENLLNQVVTAFSSAMELRDPYTAGHQRRVAELSLAIAKEMGFTEEKLQGLWVAALLHDIGKGLFVPTEILSKPGSLSSWEMALVKVHPQAGSEILQKIDFPWPVAEIVYQHHERLNGSGYPRGLKGQDILLEAKIIAVADVVEAISSHRPYRPALGIEKALEEIVAQKGRLYDPEIVEACQRIFSRGFTFSKLESRK
ncbi:MAG: PAS domain S-box protein [Candidatus Aminicenantes bacterium]|nr:PAS domain S-box protein [Candidatus Aminicenantes bacterium]